MKRNLNMKVNSVQEEMTHAVLPLLVVLIVFLFSGFCFDFFYDLNDDMVIKDIISGAYTGMPDGHTNQMLYPIGWFLSFLYSMFNGVPVYGIFMCACFGLCFYLIGYRSLSFYRTVKGKITVVVLESILIAALLLRELVFVQYSVVCGLLAATACFWFYTTPNNLRVGEFWKRNLAALLLVWIAFLIRSEMLLLMCPFIAAVGIYHWIEEVKFHLHDNHGPGTIPMWKRVLSRNNILKYIGFAGGMVLGLGIFLGIDSMAYSSAEWKEFRGFFDARTDVYDYTWYPNYEENQEFYEEIGVSYQQYQLIDKYNFGLDETIDANTLEKIAEFGEKQHHRGNLITRLKNAVWNLGYWIFAPEEAPYNYFVLVSYVLVFALAVLQKNKSYIGKLVLLFAMRNVSWLYLILAERVVPRISHPLYVIEFLVLLAILVKELYDRPLWNVEKFYRIGVAAILGLMAVVVLPFSYMNVSKEQQRREAVMVNQKQLDAYAKEHEENYYYLDVYSTVSFTEKMFKDVDNSHKNYDLLGGWICNSPLQRQARSSYVQLSDDDTMKPGEVMSIQEALLTDNVYFAISQSEEVEFLIDFYEEKGKNVTLELQDTVGEGEDAFQIYKVSESTVKKQEKTD